MNLNMKESGKEYLTDEKLGIKQNILAENWIFQTIICLELKTERQPQCRIICENL